MADLQIPTPVDTVAREERPPRPYLLVPCDPRLVGFVLGKNRSWLKETGEQAKADGYRGAYIAWMPARDLHYGCFKVTAASAEGVDHLYKLVKDKEKQGLKLLEDGDLVPRRYEARL